MAKLAHLALLVPPLLDNVLSVLDFAESKRPFETSSAARIQALFRAHKIRKGLRSLLRATVHVQRLWRGYLGRMRFDTYRAHADEALRKVYFTAAATEIQRIYRGHLSRVHIHSFYARKAYLQAVASRSDDVNRANESTLHEQLVKLEHEQAEAATAAFRKTIQGMHHLVSTHSCAGIYNSPFSAVVGGKPSVAGRPLEDHLRETTKDAKGAHKPVIQRSTNSLGSTKMTIRASEPYLDERDRRMRTEQASSALRMSKSPFFTAVKQRPVSRQPTLNASEPFHGAFSAADRRREEKAMRAGEEFVEPEQLEVDFSNAPSNFHTAIKRQHLFEETLV